jgi:Bacterial transglutaminase-like N-terminal region
MIPLAVRHRTAYRYRRRVSLWPHRLMLRPRESHELQVISCVVTVSPPAQVTWAQDVFGNAVATAVFEHASDNLVIESAVELRLEGSAWPIFNFSASAIVYPFRYSDDDWTDLGSLTGQQYPEPGHAWRIGRARSSAAIGQTPSRCSRISAPVRRSATRAGWTKGHRRRSRLWIAASAPAGISPCCSSKRPARWSSAQGWCRATSSTPIRCFMDRRTPDQHTPGPKSLCRGPVGPASARQTAASAAPTSFRSLFARDIRHVAPVSGSYAGNTDLLEAMAVEVLVTSSSAPARRRGSEQPSSVGAAHDGAIRFSA